MKRLRYVKENNSGFTLIEMLVVILIMSIMLGLAAWGATGWILHSEYVKNEGQAQVVYFGAQSALSNAQARGVLENVMRRLEAESVAHVTTDADKAAYGLDVSKDNDKKDHDYFALAISKGDYNSGASNALIDLIEPYIFDKDTLNGTYFIEFDKTAGKVYSVFYSSWSPAVSYGSGVATDRSETFLVNAESRKPQNRSPIAMGYYGADQVNVANLGAMNLRLTKVLLDNNETLNLQFGSNSKVEETDTEYSLAFFDAKDHSELFSTVVSKKDVYPVDGSGGAARKDGVDYNIANLKLSMPGGTQQTLPFIVTYNGSYFSLILDAMMDSPSEAALASLDSGLTSKNGYSITRLLGTDPKNIYATVTIRPNDDAVNRYEYSVGKPLTSETENDLYATPSDLSAYDVAKNEISKIRHLSNMRVLETYDSAVHTYSVIANLDWDANVVYSVLSETNGEKKRTPLDSATAAFPSVPALKEKNALNGGGYRISNLRLDETSAVEFEDGGATTNKVRYSGLIRVNYGDIHELQFADAVFDLSGDTLKTEGLLPENGADVPKSLIGVGILAGRNEGSLTQICFTGDCKMTAELTYPYTSGHAPVLATVDDSTLFAGIGMLAGVNVLGKDDVVDYILTQGSVKGGFGGMDPASAVTYADIETGGYRLAGVGGISGFLFTSDNAVFGKDAAAVKAESHNNRLKSVYSKMGNRSIYNRAEVTGESFVGGVLGNAFRTLSTATDTVQVDPAGQIRNCHSDAFVGIDDAIWKKLKNKPAYINGIEEENAEFTSLDGLYVGGICGYDYHCCIKNCSFDMQDKARVKKYNSTSASEGSETVAHAALTADSKGVFVGGICGFSYDGLLHENETIKDGYLLGYNYVGGIVGSMKSAMEECVLVSGETVNNAYVIGHSYVGGICGINSAGSTISDCHHNGVTAGYGVNIGGIAGANVGSEKADGTTEREAKIINCSAGMYDYGNKVYNLVKDGWGFYGSNVGGQVGFNEHGRIEFRQSGSGARAVSSIAVGKNNVGGFVGYNGINGTIRLAGNEEDYISGRVYGTGDFVGGYIGLNLAPEAVFGQKIRVSTISVEGNRCVGGVVGGNILELRSDATFTVKYDNRSSSIAGNGIVGGLIGYSRALKAQGSAALPSYEGVGEDDWIGNFLVQDASGLWQSAQTGPLKDQGQNEYKLVIGDAAVAQKTVYNNAEVSASMIGGGLIGMSDNESPLVLIHAQNTGKLVERPDGKKLSLASLVDVDSSNAPKCALLGGVVGASGVRTIVDDCSGTGAVELVTGGYGSITGINTGYVVNCETAVNIGRSGIDYVGGICAVNYEAPAYASADASVNRITCSLNDVNYAYYSGNVQNCYAGNGYTVEGSNEVGGITGANIARAEHNLGGRLIDCEAFGTISGKADVGGLIGLNCGSVSTYGAIPGIYNLTVRGTENVGGVVGKNDSRGVILFSGTDAVTPAVNTKITVTATGTGKYAGGIVGYLAKGIIEGKAKTATDPAVTVKSYAVVTAYQHAGGIAGRIASDSRIKDTENFGTVLATNSLAGGIVPEVGKNNLIKDSIDRGNISASRGYASGICAINHGTLEGCVVRSMSGYVPVITTNSADGIGGLMTTINDTGAMMKDCVVASSSTELSTEAEAGTICVKGNKLNVIGYLCGQNKGTIDGGKVGAKVTYQTGQGKITLGGVAGTNLDGALIHAAETAAQFENFSSVNSVRYLGGVTGTNYGTVSACHYKGEMSEEKVATAGNAYGGISGLNGAGGRIDDCYIDGLTIKVKGIYNALEAQSAELKIANSLCVGGIAGLNQAGGCLKGCYATGSGNSVSAVNGMVGGIVGANNGSLDYCGYAEDMGMLNLVVDTLGDGTYAPKDAAFAALDYEQKKLYMNNALTESDYAVLSDYPLYREADGRSDYNFDIGAREAFDNRDSTMDGLLFDEESRSTDQAGVAILDDAKENFVNDYVINILANGKGNLGGIVGFNSLNGSLTRCATGRWHIGAAQSAKVSAVGGIIGQNESNQAQSYLLNCGFVYRSPESKYGNYNVYLGTGNNDAYERDCHYLGGVIGSQQNRTASTWSLNGCVNRGWVWCERSNTVGGVIATWNYNGGDVIDSYNYGVLLTGLQLRSCGMAGGVICNIQNLTIGQTINVHGCENHGAVGIPSTVANGGAPGNPNYGTFNGLKPALNYAYDPATGTVSYDLEMLKSYNVYLCQNDMGGVVGIVIAPTETEKLTVNMIDCVNGREAFLTSRSRASGILGYIGSRAKWGPKDVGSGKPVVANIINCRNYCSEIWAHATDNNNQLPSRAKCSGIFGRQGDADKGKCVVSCRNCFSCTTEPNGKQYGSGDNDFGYMQLDNYFKQYCSNNYVMDYYSFHPVNAAEIPAVGETQTAFPSSQNDRVGTCNVNQNGKPHGKLGRANEKLLYVLKDSESGSYQAFLFDNQNYWISQMKETNTWLETAENKLRLYAKNSSNATDVKEVGSLCFTFDNVTDNLSYNMANAQTADPYDIKDYQVKEFFASLEAGKFENAPTNVVVSNGNGQYDVTWTKCNDITTSYDMEVKMYYAPKGTTFHVDDLTGFTEFAAGEQNLKFYTEEGEFKVPDDARAQMDTDTYDYYATVRIRANGSGDAHSPYSALTETSFVYIADELPIPQLEVIRYKDQWRVRLLNADQYAGYADWSVSSYVVGREATVYTLNEDSVTMLGDQKLYLADMGTYLTPNYIDGLALRGTAKATVKGTEVTSGLFSARVYVPRYRKPKTAGNQNDRIIITNTSLSATSTEDIQMRFTMENAENSEQRTYSDVFRLELVGEKTTAEGTVLATLASKEISFSPGKNVKQTYTFESADIPNKDQLLEYDKLWIEGWYASTGLGPVYNYFTVTDPAICEKIRKNETGYTRRDGYIMDLTDPDAPVYYYSETCNINAYRSYYYMWTDNRNNINYSFNLSEPNKNNNTVTSTGKYLVFLDAVNIEDHTVSYDEQADTLTYTYHWTDQPGGAYDTYDVKLQGSLLDNGEKASEEEIATDGVYTDTAATTFTIPANAWDYDALTLTVSGHQQTSTADIINLSRAAERQWDYVPKRLRSISAPSANRTENSLEYEVTYNASEQEGCTGYAIYVQDPNATDPVLAATVDNPAVTRAIIDLEPYAGKTIKLYVVAKADETAPAADGVQYYRSLPGVSLNVTVGTRLARPEATFALTDNLKTAAVAGTAVAPEVFASAAEGLVVDVTASSKLEGSYQVYGILYPTQAEAQAAYNAIAAETDDAANIAKAEEIQAQAAAGGYYSFGFGTAKKTAADGGSTSSPYRYLLHTLGDSTDNWNGTRNGEDETWSADYAGYYLLPLLCATNSTDVISSYAVGTPLLLPKVQLGAPANTFRNQLATVTGNAYSTADYSNPEAGGLTAQMSLRELSWTNTEPGAAGYVLEADAKLGYIDETDHTVKQYDAKVGIRAGIHTYTAGDGTLGDLNGTYLTLLVGQDKDKAGVATGVDTTENNLSDALIRAVLNAADAYFTEETADGDTTVKTYKAKEDDGTGTGTMIPGATVLTVTKAGQNVTYNYKNVLYRMDLAAASGTPAQVTLPILDNYLYGGVNPGGEGIYYLFNVPATLTVTPGEEEEAYSLVLPNVQNDFSFERNMQTYNITTHPASVASLTGKAVALDERHTDSVQTRFTVLD